MTTGAVALPAPRAARTLSGAGLLSGATLLAGLFTYAFHALAARSLGPTEYGRVAVLWAALFLAAVVLWRPLEQTLSRTLADRLARGGEGWSAVRAVGLIAAGMCAGAVAALALAWGPVTHRLFLDNDVMTASLLVGVVFYAGAYVVRGLAGGSRWFGGYALALLADALARLGLGVGIVLYASTDLAAAAVAAAAAAGVLVPLAVGRRRLARSLSGAQSAERFSTSAALAFAGPASVVAIADQVLMNAGPLLVVLAGGHEASAAAGTVFAAMMLVRVPGYLFQGFAGSLLPNLTRLHASEDGRLRGAVARTATLLVAGGIPIALLAAAFGPEAMKLLYGSAFEAGRGQLAVLGLGGGCYLAAATFAQGFLALDRPGRAAAASAVAAGVFVPMYALLPGAPLTRVAFAFTTAAVLQLALLAPLARRPGAA
jgi:O-antigen/teichoic acid export membrane protein